jgi:hypothetical protein
MRKCGERIFASKPCYWTLLGDLRMEVSPSASRSEQTVPLLESQCKSVLRSQQARGRYENLCIECGKWIPNARPFPADTAKQVTARMLEN